MKVGIIGSGNVATVLGRLIHQKKHQVVQVMSQHIDHAKLLAEEWGANYTDFDGIPDESADIYIIAIADNALNDSLIRLSLYNKPVFHTAGSVSKEVLKAVSRNYGVLYPLQSLRKEMSIIPSIPFLIDANNEETLQLLRSFAIELSNEVMIASDDERIKLHIAAVIVSNFTNHLYAIAEDFCNKEKVNFNLLKPLIMETAMRIKELSPATVQTGPALRKDVVTLDKHLKILTAHPTLRTTYLRLTDSIMNP